jgi:ABC-type glycerol-3-phosphate transport system substrate-binding protein
MDRMQAQQIVKVGTAILLGLTLLFMVGCQMPFRNLISNADPDDLPTEATVVTPTATVRTPNTVADTLVNLPQPEVITLTFWTIERFSPETELVAQLLQDFEADNTDTRVEVILKRSSGQAGTLNFLRSAQTVAPSVLPDVVVLNANDLPQAWRTNLVQPLDGLLDRALIQDLLPAARNLGTVDGNLAGVPFELDIQHAVFNTGKIAKTPLTWADVLNEVPSYQFPAAGQNGLLNDALLIQYLSAGAQLTDEQGQPIVDEVALRAVLLYYDNLLNESIIDSQIVEAGQPQDLWDAYLNGLVSMTHINTQKFLTDRRLLTSVEPVPVPSQDGQVVTISHGWVFALLTDDPVRQIAALKLIETFLQTEINATWAVRSATIPVRQSSFDQVADEDPYWLFLRSYLEAAVPPPSFSGYDQLSHTLLTAIQQVILGEATPDEALTGAVEAINQTPP